MKIIVLERNSVGTDVSVDCFSRFGELVCYPNTPAEKVAERAAQADILIANKSPLNEETLAGAKSLKLICQFATGYDNVDLEYCRRRGLKVCNVVNYSTAAVAQHTFALCLYLLEHLRHYDDYVKSGEYGAQDRFSNFDLPFTELDGKTWGIVGMGNIGKRVAHIAQAFGCRIIFYSASGRSSCADYERVEFDRLLRESDFLSIHCPLTDRTRNLIDLSALSRMKKTAILINVARGAVVNDADLYEALTRGLIAAAGLDVSGTEPLAVDNPLSRIKESGRLVITPHMAWASTEARIRLVEEVSLNIEAFLEGRERNLVC